jgi:hypothetical protein
MIMLLCTRKMNSGSEDIFFVIQDAKMRKKISSSIRGGIEKDVGGQSCKQRQKRIKRLKMHWVSHGANATGARDCWAIRSKFGRRTSNQSKKGISSSRIRNLAGQLTSASLLVRSRQAANLRGLDKA